MNPIKQQTIAILAKLHTDLVGSLEIKNALGYAIKYLQGGVSTKHPSAYGWKVLNIDLEPDCLWGTYTIRISGCFVREFHKILIAGTPDDTLVIINYIKKPPPKQRGGIYRWLFDNSKTFRDWQAKRFIKKLGIPVKKN